MLNRLHINFIVLHMSTNKADVYDSVGVVDPYDQSILIARNIENYTPIFEYAGIPEVLLYVGRWAPIGMQGMTVPG